MYSTINQLLGKKQDVILPDANSDYELANSILNYFTEKIENIRATFQTMPQPSNHNGMMNNLLSTFEIITNDVIQQTVLSYSIKC